jgi:geranylgeranyl pyrophosphate synthase
MRPQLTGEVAAHLSRALYRPVEDLLSRPSKRFRSELVEIGYLLSAGPDMDETIERRVSALARLIETIHAGSLIIDDIEDGSRVRRGRPALHEVYGLPIALNAGNWLYFEPLEALPAVGLPPAQELAVFRIVHQTLLAAHYGQALDLGVRIDEAPASEVPALCLSSLRLKSGALMSLGLQLGAILGRATGEARARLSEAGHELGVGLQILDDVGTLRLPDGHPKRFEDMKLGRPTGVWKALAEHGSPSEMACVRRAMASLPDTRALDAWARATPILETAIQDARSRMHRVLDDVRSSLGPGDPSTRRGLERLEALIERISEAYD